MKTDRFTDSIRRKLESIRPEFTEKDWAKMQATLHQATPPQPGSGSAPSGPSFTGSSWFGQPFIMAAAAVSTVLLVTFCVWQRHEINQLRQTVTQLSESPKRLPDLSGSTPNAGNTNPAPAQTQRQPGASIGNKASESKDSQVSAASPLPENRPVESLPANPSMRSAARNNRPDTVYVTRYVTVPPRQAAPRNDRSARYTETPAGSERYAAANPATGLADKAGKAVMPSADQSASSTGTPDVATTEGVDARSAAESRPTPRVSTDRLEVMAMNAGTSGSATRRGAVARSTRRGKNQLTAGTGRVSGYKDNANQSKAGITSSADIDPAGTASTEMAPKTYAVATSRPLTLDPKDWQKALVRRARTMRSTQIVFTEVQQPLQPLSQPANPLTVQVRAGVGGEISSGLSSAGVFGELLLGKNWTLGLGFSKADYWAGTFMNDHDFDDRTHRDFRQNYVRGTGPKIDIQNIDIHTNRAQIPLSLGYRIPITRTLTFLPAISTYLTLRNTETITFYYREQPFGPILNGPKVQVERIDRPVNPFTDFTVGTSLEFHKGHWAAQAGPMLTMPLQDTMNWQNTVTAGLRMRAFYQF